MNDVEKEEQRKRLIKIGIYVGVFVLAFIILKIDSLVSNKNESEEKKEEEKRLEIIDKLKNMSEDNYTENIHLIMDDDALTLEFQKSNNIIIGSKKYHGEDITFIKKEEIYYKVDENSNSALQLSDFVEFNYDKTFIDLSNIKKLLSRDIKPQYSSNKVLITYKLNDLLSIYNSYNNSTILDLGSGELILEINYNDNTLDYLLIDVTDLYNKIYNKNLEKATLNIELSESKEEDISWLDMLLK